MKKRQTSAWVQKIGAVGCAIMVFASTGFGFTVSAKTEKAVPEITLDFSSKEYETDRSVATVKTTAQSVNTVRDSIFGANTSWIDDGYGIWDSANNKPYGILLDKVKKSGVAHIRYPGGIEGDYLHWYETIGDVSKRVPQIDCFSTQYPTYDAYDGVRYPVTFGVDELFRFCNAADIKATVQLNAGNGTPQEAADYLNYVLKNFSKKKVDSFCIGNEICMSAERVDDVSVTKNPDDYINFCKQFFAKIGNDVTHDKDITLGVVGITPSHPLCAYRNWDIKVLDALAEKIDFIDVHIGYSYYSQDGADRNTSAKCFMASSKWIGSMIAEEKALIHKYAKNDADHIGIQISELGPNGGDYVRSVAGAVFLADLYNVILAEPQVTATDYLPLLNHYASAQLIGAMTYAGSGEDEYYWDNTVSYVFKMYADLIGKSVLETKVSGCQTFDADACGLVPAISDVDNASAAVYYDEKSGKGSIFLINRSLDKNESFSLSLPTSSAKISGVTELWNKDCMASNYYDNPRAVTLKNYKNYSTDAFGKLSVTTKPVSLVRVDFTCKDINVLAPKEVIKNSDGVRKTVDGEKQPGEKTAGNKTVQKTSEKTETVAEQAAAEKPVRRSKISAVIKKILKQTDYSKATKTLVIIIAVLFALFVAETGGAFGLVFYLKRKGRL